MPTLPLRKRLSRFRVSNPDVSIIVPAYNEEKTLVRLLASLAAQRTKYRVELIVVNNNSTDRTQVLLDEFGVRSLFVREQGVAYARQAGLEAARGRFIANADADSQYPPTWLDALINPLHDQAISCTYGTHSFVPSPGSSALQLALYGQLARLAARMRRNYGEYINVMGFNFAFRRSDALAVGGFDPAIGHQGRARQDGAGCEDGWMALCLMQRGRLLRVGSAKARALTSDRRLLFEGGPCQIFLQRVQREWQRFTNDQIRNASAPVRSSDQVSARMRPSKADTLDTPA